MRRLDSEFHALSPHLRSAQAAGLPRRGTAVLCLAFGGGSSPTTSSSAQTSTNQQVGAEGQSISVLGSGNQVVRQEMSADVAKAALETASALGKSGLDTTVTLGAQQLEAGKQFLANATTSTRDVLNFATTVVENAGAELARTTASAQGTADAALAQFGNLKETIATQGESMSQKTILMLALAGVVGVVLIARKS